MYNTYKVKGKWVVNHLKPKYSFTPRPYTVHCVGSFQFEYQALAFIYKRLGNAQS